MKNQTMNAVISTEYGSPDVFEYRQVPKPEISDNEVLIKIFATSVTNAATAIRTGTPFIGRLFLGLSEPKIKIAGTDFSGQIIAVGKNVTRFEAGDEVFGSTDMEFGTYAEFKVLHENAVILKKPTNITHAEATAIVDGATTAHPFLKEAANLQHGQNILINGASGSIGTAAIQIAHIMGATVTAVASGANKRLVEGLGVHRFIDYTKQHYWESEQKYDVVFDTVGKSSFKLAKKVLTPTGIYLTPVLSFKNLSEMMFTSMAEGKKVIFMATGMRTIIQKMEAFTEIRSWLEEGKLIPIIDRMYHLPQIAEAHRYVDTGHKKGNVVIDVADVAGVELELSRIG